MILGDGPTLGDHQSRMNRSTRGQWDWYARHRAEIEKLIVPEGRGGRICVLGAGNCNDLDLRWLCEAYAEVRLVDIDRAAVEQGVEGQGVLGRVVIEGGVDLTGIADVVKAWRGREVTEAEVLRAIENVNGPSSMVRGGFDVMVSPCVLSQLLMGVRDVLGAGHPSWPALKGAIVRRHLRTVVEMTRPGGRGVLVVDLSSTAAIPGLDRAEEREWGDLMRVAVRDGKSFAGLEPGILRGVFERETGSEIRDVGVSVPWVWHLGWGKAFLCYGMVVRKGIENIQHPTFNFQ
jgi:hypothetical protein